MSIVLKIFILLLLLIQLFLVFKSAKGNKLSIKYACFWVLFTCIMGIIVIFPNLIFYLSKMFGFEKTSNMIFLLGFFFLFYVIFILSTSISIQNKKINLLVQELSLLKESVLNDGKKD